MKKILMIGATSLVGQAVLQNKEYEYTCPTRQELDLTIPESIAGFDYDGFDCLILIAGAGMRAGRKFEFEEKEVTFEYISNTIKTNCIGTTMLLNQYLKKNKKGYVVIMGTIGVTEMHSRNVVYASSKTYLDRMVDLLSNIYDETVFIKINPSKMESRVKKDMACIPASVVAETIWSSIKNKIKRVDILE